MRFNAWIGALIGVASSGCWSARDDAQTTFDAEPPGTEGPRVPAGGESSADSGTGVADDDTGMSSGSPNADSDSESDSGGASETKFDIAQDVPAPATCADEIEFSHIWIANSPEGTVSKIDTTSLVELGRYVTRPDGNGNPSRTSVNLDADVAIANRAGGITKIHARLEDCDDATETSSGPDDVKPWMDGCIAWYAPFDQYTTQRPVAWTQGTLNPDTCRHEDAKIWAAGGSTAIGIEVLLLDGDTGILEATVPIPGVPLGLYNLGLYGAAVDQEGNLWTNSFNDGYLVRVRLDDLGADQWEIPITSYGMTVDHYGRPWICNEEVARFDPLSEAWTIGDAQPGSGGAGCMEDSQGRVWVAGYSLMAVDVDSMAEIAAYPLPVLDDNPDTGYARGVSIDFEGKVWAPAYWADRAYRLDPDTAEFEAVDGLNRPYTYSDMTGFQLASVNEPEG